MSFEIIHDDDDERWDHVLSRIRRSNLLQSRYYGRVFCDEKNFQAHRCFITVGGKEVGIAQYFEKRFWGGLVKKVVLDRCPLWIDYGSQDLTFDFFKYIMKAENKSFLSLFRMIPEGNNNRALKFFNNRKPIAGGYATYWLDLNHSEEALYKRLSKKWRSDIRVADGYSREKKIVISWDLSEGELALFLKMYQLDKEKRGYYGPSAGFLKKMAYLFMDNNALYIGRVVDVETNKSIAAAMIFGHGKSATYQAGWVTPLGRRMRANHFLLWNALSVLKEQGYIDFDLGGVNDGNAKGIKHFKKGLGGEYVKGSGMYTFFCIMGLSF